MPLPATTRAILVLSITQIIGWGATFYFPAVAGVAMGEDMGIPLTLVMSGPTIMLVTMAAVSWPLGRVFEHYGARPVMVCGSVLAAAGLVVQSVAGSGAAYALAWLLLGLAGAGSLTTAAQIALRELAGADARRALGLMLLAGGVTPTLFWPLTVLLQDSLGWRLTSLLYGVAMLVVCLPLHALFLSRTPYAGQSHAATEPAPAIDPVAFAMTAISFAANGFVTWGFSLTTILLFTARGLDPAQSLFAASSIGVMQLAARLVDFLVSRRWSGLATGLAAAALFPLAFALLLATSGMVAALAFALIFGLAGGITAVTRASLPLEIFPPRAYAQASARLAVPLNLSFAAAPPAFTAVLGRYGAEAALWTAMALSFVGFTAMGSLLIYQTRLAKPSDGAC